MDRAALRERITEQFSLEDDRADVWGGFDLFLETEAFLNLGYSRWYQPHVVGSSQERLAVAVGTQLERELTTTAGRRLLDVGCGRGGPAVKLSTAFGFDTTGIDLVPDNVALARENARTAGATAAFATADATALPVKPESMAACTAVDSLVYVPERAAAVAEMAGALEPGGSLVVSDLVRAAELADADRDDVAAFEDAWDMPTLGTVAGYRDQFRAAGLELQRVEDITDHSVGRFRKWTGLFLRSLEGPAGPALRWLLRRLGLDPATIRGQVRAAHRALPHLGHAMFVARRPSR